MPQSADTLFYQLYFQIPGVAEAEFERDVHSIVRTILYSISGDAPRPREQHNGSQRRWNGAP